jgi:thiamine-monophosphate kinase
MNMRDLTEFGLIRRIAPRFAVDTAAWTGIGDDCAVLPASDGLVQLVTTDLLLEDVHFLVDRIAPDELGHKALAVNISDIAAMGGSPTSAFLSIGVPKETKVDWLDCFFAGVKALSDQTNCCLLGGDTTQSPKGIVINFAVLGSMQAARVKYRSGAKPGDILAVTGFLGDSAAGLRCLLKEVALHEANARTLVRAHHMPSPHVQEGQWLAAHDAVHAMMDVSDGVDSDLRHIMEQSRVGAELELEKIPTSNAFQAVCAAHGWHTAELAVAGGEDYVLLCAVDAASFDALARAYETHFGRPLFAIGRILDGSGLTYIQHGKPTRLAFHGFDHFTS